MRMYSTMYLCSLYSMIAGLIKFKTVYFENKNLVLILKSC